jgi:hypothetical protein
MRTDTLLANPEVSPTNTSALSSALRSRSVLEDHPPGSRGLSVRSHDCLIQTPAVLQGND